MYSKKYEKLFTKCKIGNIEVRNRIVMSPMGTGHVGPDSRVTQELIDFYAERARNGVGMIITEAHFQSEIDATPFLFGIARMDHMNKIAREAELVNMVKYYGAVPCIQISMGMGRQSDAPRLVPPVAPSAVPATNDLDVMCRELTKEEIKELISKVAASAELAVAAGYQVAEIHGHAGYLIDQFISPDTNFRTDEYGGSLENRLRVAKEILEEIKKRVGNSLALIFRVSVDQKADGCRTLEEGIEICKLLESYGYDALDVDAGRYEVIDWIFPTELLGPGCMSNLAHEVKNHISIPVLNAGSYNYPELAEKALQNNDTDFVNLGRSLLADPEWSIKAKLGKEEEIRPCIRCNDKCIMNVLAGKEMTCSVNPQCGRESRFKVSKADHPRRVTVIGGGPGGMEAAIIAADRGHKVTIIEAKDRLGGQLNYADLESFKWGVADFKKYLIRQVELKDIDVKLNTKADLECIRATNPDAVVVATGAELFIPQIFACPDVISVADLPIQDMKEKEKIVVIGGGLVGSETALGFAMEGHDVTVLEMRDGIAVDLNVINRVSLLGEMGKYNVKTVTGVTCNKIADGKITATDKDNKTVEFEFDRVIAATGTRKVNEICDAVENAFPETYILGDCTNIGKIPDAVHRGYIVGTQI